VSVADPRPRLDGDRVVGARCTACGYPTAPAAAWCPVCTRPQAEASFGPGGRVWSSTVVHIPVGDRPPPFGLAYVDLDEGPRVLAHLAEPAVLPPGTRVRVRVTGAGDHGDIVVTREG
jgi:uncharacterized OB-fold protein